MAKSLSPTSKVNVDTSVKFPFSVELELEPEHSTGDISVAPYKLHHSTWTTGAKCGVGTAFYNPERDPSQSNVWFTLARGVLTEVYYPDVAHANLRMLELIVTDGKTFIDTEQEDMLHECKIMTSDALNYRQVNTARSGMYKIEKTYVTDPHAHSVLCEVKFYALVGQIKDYQVFIYAQPILSNSVNDDTAFIVRCERTFLVAKDESATLALTATVPFRMISVGHVGVSDGLDELRNHFQLIHTYCKTEIGHVALLGQLDLSCTLVFAAPPTSDAPSTLAGASSLPEASTLAAPLAIPGATTSASTPIPAPASAKEVSFTIVLGFGKTVEEAVFSATQSASRPFQVVERDYRLGWQTYLNQLSLPTVGSLQQARIAVMALKAHEDKLRPGAIVASLSIPWGESVSAAETHAGGYHLVWPRDLYQVASALLAVGDMETAKRALDYLEHVLQKEDGSFPQNTWLDGKPYWSGLQLDQVAFPILLMNQLQETAFRNRGDMQSSEYALPTLPRFDSFVKPAADFIVQNGPLTQQERWEENSGYSPSTIAAEIAALVVAAKMARQAGDYSSAAIYLYTADKWTSKADDWTCSTSSYLRISDTANPNDGHWIELKNGGGWHPKQKIVDAGFLELVRLGIKSADDPMVTKSLDRIDKTICCKMPYGPLWYRYNHDGYGEKEDGSPYTGDGVGRLWPLLSGERGEYEVALSLSKKRFSPENLFGAEKLLEVMEKAANCGGMIPEQVWDKAACPNHQLDCGEGTGSATPLAWAMAQYLRLGACISEGRVVEMPSVVWERYGSQSPLRKFDVHMQSPAEGEIVRDSHLQIRGQTLPNATVLLKREGHVKSVTADLCGTFSGSLLLETLGEQKLTVIAYDNDNAISDVEVDFCFEPNVLFEIENPELDGENKPRVVQYPTNEVFKPGDFDIRKLVVLADKENTYFQIRFGNLDNPWDGPSGISKQVVDIYLDTKDASMQKERSTLGLGAQFDINFGWTKLIRVTGNWFLDAHVYNSDLSNGGSIHVFTNYNTNTLIVRVSNDNLGGCPEKGWSIMAVVAGEHYGGLRPILAYPDEWTFGIAKESDRNSGFCSCIVDLLLPVGETRRRIHFSTGNGVAQLPMIRI